ncbi:late competence development ComFB family protein [Gorillibacterium sp. sgz5001074]|uniref:late competence development ComFB family protein n=1 Tax=Gorillibacterium sp. sgz5001074 TaxID=3446695 RepID=UPI003F6708AB
MQVHNLMEDIVKSCLKELMNHRADLADCGESSQADIMAIVLNALPPRYVSTDKGEMFAKTQLRAQVETDVYRELSLAIDKVMKYTRPSDF